MVISNLPKFRFCRETFYHGFNSFCFIDSMYVSLFLQDQIVLDIKQIIEKVLRFLIRLVLDSSIKTAQLNQNHVGNKHCEIVFESCFFHLIDIVQMVFKSSRVTFKRSRYL